MLLSRSLLPTMATAAVSLAVAACDAASIGASTHLYVRQTQEPGSPLYLDEPSCDFYQCSITWLVGDHVTAHWTDAPEGNVILDMMADAGATLTHHVDTVPGITTNCDKNGQDTCGQFSFVVPSAWLNGTTYGNYSLRATSAADETVQSYTDIILVKPANGTGAPTDVPYKALDPTAAGNETAPAESTSSGAYSSPTGTAAQAGTNDTQSNSTSGMNNGTSSNNQDANAAVSQTASNVIQASMLLCTVACLTLTIVL